MTWDHVHVSEREPSSQPDDPHDPPGWEDCLWCSAVELARAVGEDCPPTLAEAEALRKASGEPPGGGSNLDDLKAGMYARYGWWPSRRVSASYFGHNDLRPGEVVVMTGLYSKLPSRLRRFGGSFAGMHAVFAWAAPAGLMWCDPLAPTVVDGKRFTGELVAYDAIRPYATAGAGSWIDTADRLEGDMARYVQSNGYGVGSSWILDVRQGAEWSYLDGSPGGTFGQATTIVALGLIDGHTREYLCRITTGAPYDDKQSRQTLVRVLSPIDATETPEPEPGPGPEPDPDAELRGRQEQWDDSAAMLLGERP